MKGTLTIDGVTVDIQLTEEQEKQVKEVMEQKRWRAQKEELYWYLDEFISVTATEDWDDGTDQLQWEVGNYFPSRRQCELYKLRLESMLEMNRMAVTHSFDKKEAQIAFHSTEEWHMKYWESWETDLYDPTLFTDES